MINLMVALPAEARPLIDRLRLRAQTEFAGFRLFGNDQYRLVVSGIGQNAMAAAVGWLAGIQCAQANQPPPSVWLNAGIVGHRSLEVGKTLVAHRIHDVASDKSWYPPQLLDYRRSAEVRSVSVVESVYEFDAAYDMEASAFVQSASRFASLEFVQSLKVVSDNPDNPVAVIDRRMVRSLIENNLDAIVGYAEQMQALFDSWWGAMEVSAETEIATALATRWRFTVSQRTQLQTVLRKIVTLGQPEALGAVITVDSFAKLASASEVLGALNQYLREQPSGMLL